MQLRGALAAGMAFSRDLSLPRACGRLPGVTPTGLGFCSCHRHAAAGQAELEIVALAESFDRLQESLFET